MDGNVTRLDLLWLVAAIWFGLGVAHDNLSLKLGAVVVVFVIVIRERRRDKESK